MPKSFNTLHSDDSIAHTVDPSDRQQEQPETYDLRGESLDEVRDRLADLAAQYNAVMHGASLSIGQIDEFDPSRSTIGGKLPSIYATDHPDAAIFNAIYDKHSKPARGLREEDFGEGASSNMHMRRGIGHAAFVLPQAQAEAIKRAQLAITAGEKPELVGEGLVYLLPKEKFTQDSPETAHAVSGAADYSDHEWNSQARVRPLAVVAVSTDLLVDLLVFDGPAQNVYIFTREELVARRVEEFEQQFDGMLGPNNSDQLDSSSLHTLAAQISPDDPRAESKRDLLSRAEAIPRLPRKQYIRALAQLAFMAPNG